MTKLMDSTGQVEKRSRVYTIYYRKKQENQTERKDDI